MLVLPDGNLIDMRWKSVSYIMGEKKIIFDIVPMLNDADIVCIPNQEQCNDDMSIHLRNEFVFLLQTIEWKRDLKFFEMNIPPLVLPKDQSLVSAGSIESTVGGKELENAYLFDPSSPLTKEQVKEVYIILETRFAEGVSGKVEIVKDGTPKGSIMDKVTMPALEKNKNATIIYV